MHSRLEHFISTVVIMIIWPALSVSLCSWFSTMSLRDQGNVYLTAIKCSFVWYHSRYDTILNWTWAVDPLGWWIERTVLNYQHSAHYFRRLGSFFICWEIDTAEHTVSLSLSIWYTLINYLSKQIKYTENTATFSTHSISLSKSWDFVAGLLVKTELFAINPKKSGLAGHCTSCCWFLLLEDFLSL